MRFEVKVTPEMVDAETARRITERYSLFKQLNAARGSDDTVDFDWIDKTRAAGRSLRKMRPIPADYKSDSRWPALAETITT